MLAGKTKQSRRGFTFIELLLTMSIISAIGLFSIVNYGQQKPARDLSSTKLRVVAVLRDAASRSVSQTEGSSWGVRFNGTSVTSSFFALFANSYSSSTVNIFASLPSTLRFDTSTFTGDNQDIIFNKITGKATSTSIIGYALADPGKYFAISISSSGVVSLRDSEKVATNLALSKSAIQVSTWSPGVAPRAVDGNTDGDWGDNSITHTLGGNQEWWQVDLGDSYYIDQINVWNRTDNCPLTCPRLSDYYVIVSKNPFGAASLGTILATPGIWFNHQTVEAGRPTSVPVGSRGRYVRVQLSYNNYLHMAEVEVIGR